MSNQTQNKSLTFFEHIRELRRLVFWMLGWFLIAVATVHALREPIITFLLHPLGPDQPPLQFLTPLDPLYFILKLDFTLGFLLSLPILAVLLWRYITPAFTLKKWWVPYLLGISVLVLSTLACAYSYILVMPLLLDFLSTLAVPGTNTAFTAHGYLSFFLTTTIVLVAVFQIPLGIFLAVSLGILSTKTVYQNRPYIYVGAVIVSAIITPTTDVFSLALVAVPCIAAVEIGTFASYLIYRKRVT